MREICGLDIGTGDRGSGIVDILTSATEHDPVTADNTELKWALMKSNADILSGLRCRNDAPRFVFEGISGYGKAVGKSTFSTLLWIGRMIEAVEGRRDYGDPETVIVLKRIVSAHLVGARRGADKKTGRKADPSMDSMIVSALSERFAGMGAGWREAKGTVKKPGPLHGVADDMWSALAVAVAFAEGAQTEELEPTPERKKRPNEVPF